MTKATVAPEIADTAGSMMTISSQTRVCQTSPDRILLNVRTDKNELFPNPRLMKPSLPATPKVGLGLCSTTIALESHFPICLQELIRLPTNPLMQNLQPSGDRHPIGGGQHGMTVVQHDDKSS
jgi:hypothetical protein